MTLPPKHTDWPAYLHSLIPVAFCAVETFVLTIIIFGAFL